VSNPLDIRIGTSGWSYPAGHGTWNGLFYPARRPRGFDELSYYSERFDTVEVNSTFYRMPEPAMSHAWLKRTRPAFLFAVKLYQKFTHPAMYLARDGVSQWDLSRDDFDLFRGGIDPIAAAGRLAAVLVQFPSSFHADPDRRRYLDWLLDALEGYPLAVELRHKSWDTDTEISARLAGAGATRVLADDPFGITPGDPAGSTLAYIRLHGRNAANWWRHEKSEDRYDYLYSASELQPFARTARAAASGGRRVLMYMNNHFSAKAVANAVILKRALEQPVPGDYPPELVDRYPELKGVVATSGLPL
jgi:uncharacterized protein YecE (DUF72 family)